MNIVYNKTKINDQCVLERHLIDTCLPILSTWSMSSFSCWCGRQLFAPNMIETIELLLFADFSKGFFIREFRTKHLTFQFFLFLFYFSLILRLCKIRNKFFIFAALFYDFSWSFLKKRVIFPVSPLVWRIISTRFTSTQRFPNVEFLLWPTF